MVEETFKILLLTSKTTSTRSSWSRCGSTTFNKSGGNLMTYTQAQYGNYLVSVDKLKQDREIAAKQLEEQARANRANEALKSEANRISEKAAELNAETSKRTAEIAADANKYHADKSAEASKYSTDVKRLTDQEYIANETQKITNDLNLNSELNEIRRITAESGAKLNSAQVDKINAEMSNMLKEITIKQRQLEGQLDLWKNQANKAGIEAKLAPIETAIRGASSLSNIINESIRTGQNGFRNKTELLKTLANIGAQTQKTKKRWK